MAHAQPELDLSKCPYCGAVRNREIWLSGKVIKTFFRCNTVAPIDDIVERSDRCILNCRLRESNNHES